MNTAVKEPRSTYVIRFGDCDPFGHLNNSRYFDYLINAREDHLRDILQWDYQQMAIKGLGWVVQQHEIMYLKPAKFYEKVGIQSSVIGFTPHYIQVECLMYDEAFQQIKTLLWTKFYHVNLSTGRKAEHTPDLMQYFGQLKIEGIGTNLSIKERLSQLSGRPSTIEKD
jgi:acyl-CoA thioester hydrolase